MTDKRDIYHKALGLIDLTSLNPTDTYVSISSMVEKVNRFHDRFPDYPLPASVCVFPNFASVVKSTLEDKSVHVTVVGGCFPSSQSPLEIKMAECKRAVMDGADEVDIVLPLSYVLEGRYDMAQYEIAKIGSCVRGLKEDVILKVILETGALREKALIEDASYLAMEAGADFIKTSTGKMSPSATPEAAQIMCSCISSYFRKSGKMVGFKPAGGISTPDDAVIYYNIVKDILGTDWLDRRYFRFGASRMANNLLSALECCEVKYY